MRIEYMKSLATKKSFWYFFFLTVLVVLPFLAPVFRYLGTENLSKPIYFIYSFFCHQFDSRSVHLFDNQMAWCARDTGIWLGILTGSILVYKKKMKQIKVYHLIIFTIPIALDGGIQTISTILNLSQNGFINSDTAYLSNNFFRFMTGSFFGLGVGNYITPYILELDVSRAKVSKQFCFAVTKTIIALTYIYIVIVALWQVTSHIYKPTNFLDSIPKVNHESFFARRSHGDCPTSGVDDALQFDCFFN